MSAEQFALVKDIVTYSGSGRKATNEEKMAKCMEIILPMFHTLEQCELLLKQKQLKNTGDLIDLFLQEYSTYSEHVGEARVDMPSFQSDVLAEEKSRKKSKKNQGAGARASRDAYGAEDEEPAPQQTCVIGRP